MLSRARCKDEEVAELDNEEGGQTTLAITQLEGLSHMKNRSSRKKNIMKSLRRLGSIYERHGKKEPRAK